MAYPFDYFSAITRANGELALKLGEITRQSMLDLSQVSRDAFSDLPETGKLFEPGAASATQGEVLSSFWGNVEKNRSASLVKLKDAFDAWQGAWAQAFTDAAGTLDKSGTSRPAVAPAASPAPAPSAQETPVQATAAPAPSTAQMEAAIADAAKPTTQEAGAQPAKGAEASKVAKLVPRASGTSATEL